MFNAIEPDWAGETCHILAGGPSVTADDLAGLLAAQGRGERVIAVNSSLFSFPTADLLFFADLRWWAAYGHRVAMSGYAGEIVTVSTVRWGQIRRLRKVGAEVGISLERDAVAMRSTSVQAAINIAFHKGCKTIVLHGVDFEDAPDGRKHHHEDYPASFSRPENWAELMQEDLGFVEKALKGRGVDYYPSPESFASRRVAPPSRAAAGAQKAGLDRSGLPEENPSPGSANGSASPRRASPSSPTRGEDKTRKAAANTPTPPLKRRPSPQGGE